MPAVTHTHDPDRAQGGRREQRKLATRAELLAAGRKLFSEKGLYEAPVEDLTATAGIAKGTLYQYFQDKDQLVLAVVADGFGQLGLHVRAHVHGARALADRAGRIAEAHAVFFAENPDLMRIFHQVRGLLQFHARRWVGLRRVLEQHIQLLATLLGHPPATAVLTLARRRQLAGALFGTVSGMASVQAALDGGQEAVLRPLLARRAGVALARCWVGAPSAARDPALNARVAGPRGGRARAAARGNDAKTPDGGTG